MNIRRTDEGNAVLYTCELSNGETIVARVRRRARSERIRVGEFTAQTQDDVLAAVAVLDRAGMELEHGPPPEGSEART